MAIDHGKKKYCQLLLDKGRFELLSDLAEARQLRTTALIREIVYEYLQATVDEDLYELARAYDSLTWKESVRNRVQGRARRKQQVINKEKTTE